MQDQMKNMLIAIFIITALAIIVFMVIFLHPYTGDEGQILHVRFTDIDKVSVGTRVTFAGKPVGEVTKISVLPEVRLGRTEKKGDVYVYELTLAVDSNLKVYNSDKVSLRTSGLLGEKSISIDPEPIKPGEKLRLVNDEIIYAEGTGSVEDTFNEFKEVADKFDKVLELITEALQELKDRGMWENIANTADNISEITARLSERWNDVDDTIVSLSEAASNTKNITERIHTGEGTLGRIVSSDDLYLRTNSILSKGETAMDDINHYGILFHLDKGWQRLRARRLNLMQKLRTPQEFRNFFNDEINQISTSISRVSMVLDKSECYPCLMDDCEYQKVFAELMRRVESLEENVKMFNIQTVDREVKKTELSECYY